MTRFTNFRPFYEHVNQFLSVLRPDLPIFVQLDLTILAAHRVENPNLAKMLGSTQISAKNLNIWSWQQENMDINAGDSCAEIYRGCESDYSDTQKYFKIWFVQRWNISFLRFTYFSSELWAIYGRISSELETADVKAALIHFLLR